MHSVEEELVVVLQFCMSLSIIRLFYSILPPVFRWAVGFGLEWRSKYVICGSSSCCWVDGTSMNW